jgi:hypothetical protein
MPQKKLRDYFRRNAGAGSPGRRAKGTDPRAELQTSVKPRVLAYFTSGFSGRDVFQPAPFNWDQIDKAIATDGYMSQGLQRYQELFWKEGYVLKGANPESLSYIRQRFMVLGLAQGQSFEKLLQEISENLVRYHNCFVVKVRNAEIGRIAGLSIKGLGGKDPIGGYFVIPTKMVSIKTDEFGKILKYKQDPAGAGKAVEWNAEDVIHITHNKLSGTQWGVPFLDAVIEDVRSFRIIEEDMLNIVHSEIYPTLWYAINGRKPDWPVDETDIVAAVEEIKKMKDNGALVTKGADEVSMLGSDGDSLDVNPYISHFKERVISGLGMAAHHLGLETKVVGEVANRLDAGFYDKIKKYQETIEDVLNTQIIFELLIEGGYDPLSAQKYKKDDPSVAFEFKEINIDAQIKRENHISTLWAQNQITHGEMRAMLGQPVDPDHAEEYHMEMVELPSIELSKSLTGPTGGDNPLSPAKGSGPSKDNPANQKGNRGGPKIKAAKAEDQIKE